MAQFNYIIRDDVDQDFKGQEIRFDNFVETPNSMWRVNQAGIAAGLDTEKSYADIYEWAEDFLYKAVRVYVGHRNIMAERTQRSESLCLPDMVANTSHLRKKKTITPLILDNLLTLKMTIYRSKQEDSLTYPLY